VTARELELDYSVGVNPCGNHVRNFINPYEESLLRSFKLFEESYKILAKYHNFL